MQTVQTQQGPVEGFVEDGVSQFLGVPYAAPPCRPGNRFEAPDFEINKLAIYRAFSFGPDVPQAR